MSKRVLGLKIQHVKQWMRIMHPSEFQIDLIDEDLTFYDIEVNLMTPHVCARLLPGLDTQPRDQILSEAVTRLFEDVMNTTGMSLKHMVERLGEVELGEPIKEEK